MQFVTKLFCSVAIVALISSCGNGNGSKIVSGGYTDQEELNISEYFQHRSGVMNVTGDRYNYTAEGRIEILPERKQLNSWNLDVDEILSDKRVDIISGCNVDAITDLQQCYLNIRPHNRGGGIYARTDSNGYFLGACVNSHDYPGKVAIIRVDKNKPIYTDKKGCTARQDAKRLEKQILEGERLLTRYAEWPNGYRDTTMLIKGSLSSAQNLITWARNSDITSLF